MKVLLHICCAPCAIYPFDELSQDNCSITGFFYNPNIHPFTEMRNRKEAVSDFSARFGCDVVFGEYDIERFFETIGTQFKSPQRCRLCWHMRLRESAAYAKKMAFDAFTSTLLVSPYQDFETIVRIGRSLAIEYGITFLDRDWRKGFRGAQSRARAEGMYRQKYCGCLFSEKERFCRD